MQKITINLIGIILIIFGIGIGLYGLCFAMVDPFGAYSLLYFEIPEIIFISIGGITLMISWIKEGKKFEKKAIAISIFLIVLGYALGYGLDYIGRQSYNRYRSLWWLTSLGAFILGIGIIGIIILLITPLVSLIIHFYVETDGEKFLKKAGNLSNIAKIRRGWKTDHCRYTYSVKRNYITCEFATVELNTEVCVRCSYPKGCVYNSEKALKNELPKKLK